MSQQIVIIGGGASGLMCARHLCSKGLQVKVIEGRDRLGGRIDSVSDGYSALERGAEFIHGNQPLTMSLAREAGVRPVKSSGMWYHFKRGDVVRENVHERDWQEMLGKLNALKEDTDIASFLNRYFSGERWRHLRETVRSFVEGYDAADTRRVSAFALREEWSENDDAQYRIEGGYMKLIDYLRSCLNNQVEVILNSTVRQIRWQEDASMEVVMENGTSCLADVVVVTVPLGVLQKGALTFVPAVPFGEDVFGRLGFGRVVKLLLTMTENFWNDVVLARYPDVSFILSDAEIPTWWTQSPSKQPILTGWLGGPDAEKFGVGEDILLSKAIDSLAYIFGVSANVVETGLVRHDVANWTTDPFSFGAYAYATVGSQELLESVKQRSGNRLFFAGEAFYHGSAMGTVEAALSSGLDAGIAIARMLHKD